MMHLHYQWSSSILNGEYPVINGEYSILNGEYSILNGEFSIGKRTHSIDNSAPAAHRSSLAPVWGAEPRSLLFVNTPPPLLTQEPGADYF